MRKWWTHATCGSGQDFVQCANTREVSVLKITYEKSRSIQNVNDKNNQHKVWKKVLSWFFWYVIDNPREGKK